MHASNTLRNDAAGDRGTEFRNRIAPTIDKTFDDTAEMQRRRCSRGNERTRTAGYDTKLLPGVSYQAANQSSCHNGADVAGDGDGGCLRYRRGIFLGVAPDGPRLLAGETYGVVVYGTFQRASAGSLRQIFTNNNRHPRVGSDNEEARRYRGEDPTTGEGGSKQMEASIRHLSRSRRATSPSSHLPSYVSQRYLLGICITTGTSSRSPCLMDVVRRSTKVPARYGLKETFGFLAPDGSNCSMLAEGYRHHLSRTISPDIRLIEIIPFLPIIRYCRIQVMNLAK